MKNKLILITALVSFSVATKVFSFKPDCYAQFESNYASITSSYSSTLTSIYFEAARCSLDVLAEWRFRYTYGPSILLHG